MIGFVQNQFRLDGPPLLTPTQTTQRPNDQMTSKIKLSIHLEVVLRLDLFLLLEVLLRLSQGSLVQRPVAKNRVV